MTDWTTCRNDSESGSLRKDGRMSEARDNARAWDEGCDFVTRHPGMSAEYVRAANPYRQTEGTRA